MRYSNPIFINADKAKEIVSQSNLTQAQIGQCIGKSPAWFSQVLKAGKISSDDMNKIKRFLNIDLYEAEISEEAWNYNTVKFETLQQRQPIEDLRKIVEDYSYARSNDCDRIVNAIDRLTEVIEQLVEKL